MDNKILEKIKINLNDENLCKMHCVEREVFKRINFELNLEKIIFFDSCI